MFFILMPTLSLYLSCILPKISASTLLLAGVGIEVIAFIHQQVDLCCSQ